MKLDVQDLTPEDGERGAPLPGRARLVSRRRFLESAALLGLSATGVLAAAAGCSSSPGHELVCHELEKLSASEIAARTALSYVERSLFPDRRCSNCALYIEAATEGACGGCKIAKGPFNPNGYCTGWAPRTDHG